MKTELKKTIRITSAILTSLLVITTVSGCSLKKTPVATAPKVITIWGFESEDLWQPTLKNPEFLKSIAGFQVKYTQKTLTDSYENDALNSILSGQGPDVWAIPNDWVYRHKDKLSPASPDTIKAFDLANNFVPSILENNIINNNVYGFSPGVDSIMLYYNPSVLDQAYTEYLKNQPIRSQDESEAHYKARADVLAFDQTKSLISTPQSTWAKFIEAVKLITKKDNNGNINVSGFAAGTTSNTTYATDIIYSLMLQNKVKMISDDMSLATFNLPTGTASGESDISGKYVLDFYTQFANPASPYYSWNNSMGNNLDLFATGKVAYILAPGSTANYFSQKFPNFSYKYTEIPQISDSSENDVTYARFYSYVVPNRSIYPVQSWIVAASAPRNSTTQEGSKTNKTDVVTKENVRRYQANVSHIWTKGRYPKDVDQIFKTAVDSVQSGQQSSENAINTAATKVTELLRKSEW